ncbi:glycosyl hydrolase 108 family protein [Phaeospirillum tilakii]|uniref:Glycosyl hydrolase 108 family protein n=1 Tax=Phaeospirillum tilakii TaxID=741673 RepID=A0ABW5CHJ5_9PROT
MPPRLLVPQVQATAAPLPASNFVPPAAAFGGSGGGEKLAQGFGQLADAGAKIAQAERLEQQRQDMEEAKSWLAKASTQADLSFHQKLLDAENSPDAGQPDFVTKTAAWLPEWKAQQLETAPNDMARRAGEAALDHLAATYTKGLMDIGARGTKVRLAADYDTSANNAAQAMAMTLKPGATDDETLANLDRAVSSTLLSLDNLAPTDTPEARQKRHDATLGVLRQSAFNQLLQTNPDLAKRLADTATGGGQGVPGAAAPAADGQAAPDGFGRAVAFTLQHEGGYAPADSNGAPVNFGINQEANPDIDVKGLTKDQATGIYRKRYWDAINGDALARQNPALAMAAFDTAAMAGAAQTRTLLARSGGDVNAFMGERDRFLAGLAAKDPEKYAPYVDAWKRRGDDLRNEISGLPTSGPGVNGPGLPVDLSKAKALLDGMAPGDLVKLGGLAEKALQQRAGEQQTALRQATIDAEAQARAGVMPDGPVRSQAEFDAAWRGDPLTAAREGERYRLAIDTARTVQGYQNLPTAALLPVVQAEIRPGADAVEIATAQVQQRAAAAVIAAREKDPWGVAIRNGEFGAQPVNPASADFPAQVAQRAAALPAMMEKYGVPAKILSEDEAKVAAAQYHALTPDQKTDSLDRLGQALPNRGAFVSLLGQIAPDSPVTRLAGGMLAYPGQRDVATTLLKGDAMMNPTTADKQQDGKGTALPLPTDESFKKAILAEVGPAFIGQGNAASNRFETAFQGIRAYYAARAFETGKINADKAVPPDSDLLREAVKGVTGGVYKWSDHATFVPLGMTESQFEAQLQPRVQAALDASGRGDTSWRLYDLIETENGKYQLAIKGRFLPGAMVDFAGPVPSQPSPTVAASPTLPPAAAPGTPPAPAAASPWSMEDVRAGIHDALGRKLSGIDVTPEPPRPSKKLEIPVELVDSGNPFHPTFRLKRDEGDKKQ